MRKNDQMHEDRVSLDHLFELKRQEKPASGFWDEFEAQLQQKMLGSMVDRRSVATRVWQFAVRKLLPLSLAGSALAALVISMTPFWQSGESAFSGGASERASSSTPEASVTAVAMVPESVIVDFHEAGLPVSDFDSEVQATPELGTLELSVTMPSNEVYETNDLVASSGSSLPSSAEKLF